MSTTKQHIQPSSTEGLAQEKGQSAVSLPSAPSLAPPQPEVPPSFHTNGPPNCSQPFPNLASDDLLVRLKALEQENQQLKDDKRVLQEEKRILQNDNITIRKENISLREENTSIRKENTKLRNKNAEQQDLIDALRNPTSQPVDAPAQRNPENQYYIPSQPATLPSPQSPTNNPFAQDDKAYKKTYRKPHADRVLTPEDSERALLRKKCLNPVYTTRRATRFWDALIDEHIVDKNYQPLCSRSQMGEIAYCLSKLNINNNGRTDWKTFEDLWGLHNLCADWRRLEKNETADRIRQLFEATAI